MTLLVTMSKTTMCASQIENCTHIIYGVQMEAEGNNGFPAQARIPGAREA